MPYQRCGGHERTSMNYHNYARRSIGILIHCACAEDKVAGAWNCIFLFEKPTSGSKAYCNFGFWLGMLLLRST